MSDVRLPLEIYEILKQGRGHSEAMVIGKAIHDWLTLVEKEFYYIALTQPPHKLDAALHNKLMELTPEFRLPG